MVLPSIQAWVEQTRLFAGGGIRSSGVVGFMQITVTAAQREVVIFVQSACGRRVDMLDFERDVEGDLGRSAIFAPV
jgi:hypothetical protein